MTILLSLLFALVADTVKVEEVSVVATPRENVRLAQQPLSYSSFDAAVLQNQGVTAAKDVASMVPNLFMPRYGSRQTSAVYIRGIGSRMGAPAVGLYIDNVPVLDKSAYDFSLLNAERIDVLRGPQGTLFGKNAMGGIIRVTTTDPLSAIHGGNKVAQAVSLGYTTRATGRRAAYSLHWRPVQQFGMTFAGFYEGKQGFFRNTYDNTKADKENAGGGRLRMAWRPSDVVKLDYTLSYEQSAENACPYFLLDEDNHATDIAQNRQSTYRRRLLTQGLTATHLFSAMQLTSVTSHQWMRDRLFMDQDFTAQDVFSLCQRQKMHNVSEELSLKSRPNFRFSHWQWSSGIFASYQSMKTNCPVNFFDDGIDYLNGVFANVMPTMPPMSLAFTGNELAFRSQFNTPSVNASLFHQSTVKLCDGLEAIVGIRGEYNRHNLDMTSRLANDATYTFAMPSMSVSENFASNAPISGTFHKSNWEVLPKVALQYRGKGALSSQYGEQPVEWGVYGSAAKGYRSGGFNIQSYSNLGQQELQRNMMLAVKDYCTATINALPIPDASKEKAIAAMTGGLDKNIPTPADISALYYKPEESWNYEVGGNFSLKAQSQTFTLAASLFWMDARNLQLTQFAAQGYGRETVNAGKSRSRGLEVSMTYGNAWRTSRIDMQLAYGFTDSRFRGKTAEDLADTHVPFVPLHTMTARLDWRHDCGVSMGASLEGAGKVHWYQGKSATEPFYALLGAHVGYDFALGKVGMHVGAYAKNITANGYRTFQFMSMGREYAQKGTPRHFGFEVKMKF